MPVSADYQAFVLEQLGQVTPVRSRRMFGGLGVYAGDLFFALVDDDRLYLKVDDVTRPDFVAAGSGPFRPYGDGGEEMSYYEVPADALEDVDELRGWVRKAIEVAGRAAAKRRGVRKAVVRKAASPRPRGPRR